MTPQGQQQESYNKRGRNWKLSLINGRFKAGVEYYDYKQFIRDLLLLLSIVGLGHTYTRSLATESELAKCENQNLSLQQQVQELRVRLSVQYPMLLDDNLFSPREHYKRQGIK